MTDLARAIALSGAIDQDMMNELIKWRLPHVEVPADGAPFSSPEDAVNAIENALTSSNQVEVRVTDLEILKAFLQTRVKGTLHAVNTKDNEKGDWPVQYGTIERLRTTEYIIPWRSESIEELLTNGETYLLTREPRRKVYFSRVQDLYFGEQKSFMICTPISENNGQRRKA